MKKFPNYLISKGGGYSDVPAADVKERVEKFIRKTKFCTPQDLPRHWKGLVIYTLVEYFEWDVKDAADYLDVCVRTAKNRYDEAKSMYKMAYCFTKNTSNGSKFIFDLRDYIKYNIYRW